MNKIEPEHREAAQKVLLAIGGNEMLMRIDSEKVAQIIADSCSVSALREKVLEEAARPELSDINKELNDLPWEPPLAKRSK